MSKYEAYHTYEAAVLIIMDQYRINTVKYGHLVSEHSRFLLNYKPNIDALLLMAMVNACIQDVNS